jgi:hypothetical protein
MSCKFTENSFFKKTNKDLVRVKLLLTFLFSKCDRKIHVFANFVVHDQF